MNYTPEEISILERQAVAKNPETSKNFLKELANDPEKKVRVFVAANVNTPKTVLTTLAGEGGLISRYVATNPNTPAKVLTQLAERYSEYVVSNSNAPETLLKKLAESSSVIDRYYLAANPHTPVSVLRKLADNEESPLVLENVAWNPNAPEDLLADIRESGERWAIVTEIDPYLDVEKIGNDYQIASHINTSLSTLEKLAEHENWLVRYLVIQNPNTPKSLADAIVSEIAQTESLPHDSRKCLVLNMLNKMPLHIPFESNSALPIIAIADEIVDFRWHYFDNTESRVIGFVQRGEEQSNVNEDEFDKVCRIVSIGRNTFQVDEGDLFGRLKDGLLDALVGNFIHVQCWLSGEGFSFTPYNDDFLEIYNQQSYALRSALQDESYWNLDADQSEELWCDDYLNELIESWFLNDEYGHILDSYDYDEIVDKLHELASTYEEHSRYVLEFWDSRVLNNRTGTPVFNEDTFCCNPEYDILGMLEKLQSNSETTTKDELKATISRLLEIAPLANIANDDDDYDNDDDDDDNNIVAVLAKHQDLVIEVSGLQIVSNSDEIDENNEDKVYFYRDDSCTDYDSFVDLQNWSDLFRKSEGGKFFAYIAYLLIKIILFNETGEA